MKNTIKERIIEIRKRKGLTQDQLADEAGVNIRTIQRIEAGETEPRGYTLSAICKALDLNIEQVYVESENSETMSKNQKISLLLHASVMAGLIIPLGDMITPAIVWGTNKRKVDGVDAQGKNILVSRMIVYLILTVIAVFNTGFGKMELIVIVYGFTTVVYPLITVVIIALNKNAKYFYPRFFK